jgi:hypothetical protein
VFASDGAFEDASQAHVSSAVNSALVWGTLVRLLIFQKKPQGILGDCSIVKAGLSTMLFDGADANGLLYNCG